MKRRTRSIFKNGLDNGPNHNDILQNATKSFDNVLGEDQVKGFYKNVDGQDIATYIYKSGPNAGEIATTVVLTPAQMTKFKLK